MKKLLLILSMVAAMPFIAQAQMRATVTAHSVVLNWTATTTACTSPCTAITYQVLRGTTSGGESATPIATSITGTTFTDTNVALGNTYFYQVEAVEAWTGSPLVSNPSNEATATFPVAPSAPTAVVASPN